jgi:hypothetical protein
MEKIDRNKTKSRNVIGRSGSILPSRVNTMDGTWVHHFDPETKKNKVCLGNDSADFDAVF